MMPQPEPRGIERFVGADLLSADGEKLGSVSRFMPNRLSNVPEWVLVNTGLLRANLIVPVAGASFGESKVTVPYSSSVVLSQPEIEFEEELTSEAEDLLSAHFDLGAPEAGPA